METPDRYTVVKALLAIFGSTLALIIMMPSMMEMVGADNASFIRIVAGAFAGSSSAGILYLYLKEKIRTLPLLFTRGHVVVCGLNYHTFLLVRDLMEKKIKPVIIESDGLNPYVESCATMGLLTLIGPPSDPAILKRVGVKNAGGILSLSDVDEYNAEVALTVMRMVPQVQHRPIPCTIQVVNPQLYGMIRKHAFLARKDSAVRIEFFNRYAVGVRALLARYPPALPGEATPRPVIIIGAGRMGESLTIRIARTWYQSRKGEEPRRTMILLDVNAQQIRESLLRQYPKIQDTCDLIALPLNVQSADFQTGEFLADPLLKGGFIAYICLDDDSLGLYAALTMQQKAAVKDVRFIVRMDHNTSVAKLISENRAAVESVHNIHPVNMFEITADSQLILAGEEEILARAIHENYCAREREKGQTQETNRLIVSWEELGTLTSKKDGIDGEQYRESNRQQANFIWTKLSLVGCSIGPVTDWDAPATFRFSAEDIERLAWLEHDRWMQEKIRNGWRYGGMRDDAQKFHPSLVSYDQLSDAEKEKDRDTIRQIPELLSQIDFQVYRD